MLKVKRLNRHKKLRKKISGSPERLRVSVFRSTQHIYAQIIDDTKGVTLVAQSDLTLKTGSKKEKAFLVGENLAKKALKSKISKVVFDRGGFRYHGRIEAVAQGLRKGGLEL